MTSSQPQGDARPTSHNSRSRRISTSSRNLAFSAGHSSGSPFTSRETPKTGRGVESAGECRRAVAKWLMRWQREITA